MGARPREKMSISDRAKQFHPFSALRGLEEALAKKERVIVEKPELSEEMMEELNRCMTQLTVGTMVKVTYYHKEECLMITGLVTRIDVDSRILKVVGTKIPFDDILKLETDS